MTRQPMQPRASYDIDMMRHTITAKVGDAESDLLHVIRNDIVKPAEEMISRMQSETES